MKIFGKLTLAFGVVALLTSSAFAQGRGFGGGGGAMLLGNKSVHQELKVTEEQASKLKTFADEMGTKQREAFQGLQDLSAEERQTKMQELQRTMQADIKKGLTEILKADQVKRFEQIQTQQAGSGAFAMPRVAEALKLTDDQKAKVKEINDGMRASMGELRQQFQDDREGAMKKMAELRKESNEKALAVLTDSQKTTWKELTGAPFEVKFEPRPNN